MDGWMGGWMDGWMDGGKSGVKDCLQQSKITCRSPAMKQQWVGRGPLNLNDQCRRRFSNE